MVLIQNALEAYLYYEEKQQGLGDRFLNVLKLQYFELARNPQLYSYVYPDKEKTLRDVKLAHFPYLVTFDISGADVIIYAVHNTYEKKRSF